MKTTIPHAKANVATDSFKKGHRNGTNYFRLMTGDFVLVQRELEKWHG
jgi:hypothetical protein